MSEDIKIIKAKNMGFCFGVNRAVKMTEKLLAREEKAYILGPLIHNPQEVKRLSDKGAAVINDLSSAKEGTIVIRSHGIAPDERKLALDMGFSIVDATCPYVKKVQDIAQKLYEEKYDIIILGDVEHPEVKAILGYAPGARVISNVKQLDRMRFGSSVGLISQTTQKNSLLSEVASYLILRAGEVRVFNTICNATEDRQIAACELAENVDMIIVIGGKNSANTGKLVSICEDRDVKTYHIETGDELDENWFYGISSVGITAGASTPDWLIDEVMCRIKDLCVKKKEL